MAFLAPLTWAPKGHSTHIFRNPSIQEWTLNHIGIQIVINEHSLSQGVWKIWGLVSVALARPLGFQAPGPRWQWSHHGGELARGGHLSAHTERGCHQDSLRRGEHLERSMAN